MEGNTYMVKWWILNLLPCKDPSEETECLYFITSFSGIYNDQAKLRHTDTENHNNEEDTKGKHTGIF